MVQRRRRAADGLLLSEDREVNARCNLLVLSPSGLVMDDISLLRRNSVYTCLFGSMTNGQIQEATGIAEFVAVYLCFQRQRATIQVRQFDENPRGLHALYGCREQHCQDLWGMRARSPQGAERRYAPCRLSVFEGSLSILVLLYIASAKIESVEY